MLRREDAVLVFIDVQGRLHQVMHNREALDDNLERMIRCAQVLDLPILVTEQIPDKLGPTSEPFRSLLDDAAIIPKSAFSCCGEPAFLDEVKRTDRRQFILAGIETHVCVYQTAIDLLESGHDVFVVADAVSSRRAENRDTALQAMRDAGARILPTESVLFALLRDAADPRFKELLKLIK